MSFFSVQLMQKGSKDFNQKREAVLESLGLDCGAAVVATGELQGHSLRDLQTSSSSSQDVILAAQKAQKGLLAYFGERLISNETVCRTAYADWTTPCVLYTRNTAQPACVYVSVSVLHSIV